MLAICGSIGALFLIVSFVCWSLHSSDSSSLSALEKKYEDNRKEREGLQSYIEDERRLPQKLAALVAGTIKGPVMSSTYPQNRTNRLDFQMGEAIQEMQKLEESKNANKVLGWCTFGLGISCIVIGLISLAF